MIEEYEREECENLLVMGQLNTMAQSSSKSTGTIAESTTTAATTASAVDATPAEVSNTAEKKYVTIDQSSGMNHHVIASNGSMTLLNNYQLTHNPLIPSHMAHSRTPSNGSNISIDPFLHLNYHHGAHSRSASGNFNFASMPMSSAGTSGHSRSASGGGTLDLASLHCSVGLGKHPWTHSRTPSNCSNISFISRLSEPISEVGTLLNPTVNNTTQYASAANSNGVAPSSLNSALNSLAAFQQYTDQVRLEMKDGEASAHEADEKDVDTETTASQPAQNLINSMANSGVAAVTSAATMNGMASSLANLQLGSIDEIDANNDGDSELNELKTKFNNKKEDLKKKDEKAVVNDNN
jgi:hypothetical protein